MSEHPSLTEMKDIAASNAQHRGHELLPWMDSPFPGVGSPTSCHVCGMEIRVVNGGYWGQAVNEDCHKHRV